MGPPQTWTFAAAAAAAAAGMASTVANALRGLCGRKRKREPDLGTDPLRRACAPVCFPAVEHPRCRWARLRLRHLFGDVPCAREAGAAVAVAMLCGYFDHAGQACSVVAPRERAPASAAALAVAVMMQRLGRQRWSYVGSSGLVVDISLFERRADAGDADDAEGTWLPLRRAPIMFAPRADSGEAYTGPGAGLAKVRAEWKRRGAGTRGGERAVLELLEPEAEWSMLLGQRFHAAAALEELGRTASHSGWYACSDGTYVRMGIRWVAAAELEGLSHLRLRYAGPDFSPLTVAYRAASRDGDDEAVFNAPKGSDRESRAVRARWRKLVSHVPRRLD